MRIHVFLITAFSLLFPQLGAAEIVYGFDDGTFQGWELLTPFGEPLPDDTPVSWLSSDEVIDIGDGFFLLDATSGNFRVVPEPWANRDCLGGLTCNTQILRSPSFFLDGSGPLSIDMIGGGATGNRAFDPDIDFEPETPDEMDEFKSSSGLQGFALLDKELGQYVAHAYSTGENDGKARPSDPEHREFWETVSISADELADFANNDREYQIDIFDSYSGGWGWIGFDTVTIPGRSETGDPGDLDGDGDCDAADIDALGDAIRNNQTDAKFDVDSSGSVDADDRKHLVEVLKNTYIGDSNLDGEFNTGDFVLVFQAGEYEDAAAANSTWATGDWNGDREFDSGDFVVAFQAGGFEMGPRQNVAAVPEPRISLLVVGLVLFLFLRRKNTQT